MKQVLTIAVLILTVTCFAQDYAALRHCKSKEFKYDFYVRLKDKNVHYKDTVIYTWFRAQKIHQTQGNSDGYLLDGPFSKFYHSGQLAEQGEFDNGLRVGEWKSWRDDGTLISIPMAFYTAIIFYTMKKVNVSSRENSKKGTRK